MYYRGTAKLNFDGNSVLSPMGDRVMISSLSYMDYDLGPVVLDGHTALADKNCFPISIPLEPFWYFNQAH